MSELNITSIDEFLQQDAQKLMEIVSGDEVVKWAAIIMSELVTQRTRISELEAKVQQLNNQ